MVLADVIKRVVERDFPEDSGRSGGLRGSERSGGSGRSVGV